MKSVLFFYLSGACILCNAQKLTMDRYLKESSEFMSDAYGRPLYIKAVYNVEGTPFFQDFYAPARVTLRGISYTNIPVKINLSENTVLFDNNGIEMVATIPVSKIEFYDSVSSLYYVTFKSGFPTVGKLTPETFYQILDTGTATLLKHISITFKDDKPYNSATTTRIFEQKADYYIFLGNTITIIPKNSEAFLSIIRNKRAELAAFITNNKLKTNKEESLKKIILYYNSLFH